MVWLRVGNCRRQFLLDWFSRLFPAIIDELTNGDRIATELELKLGRVDGELSHYFDNIDEIRQDMRRSSDLREQLAGTTPSRVCRKLGGCPQSNSA